MSAYGDFHQQHTAPIEVEAEVITRDLAEHLTGALASFDPVAERLADLREKYAHVVVDGIDDKEGIKVARAAKSELTKLRTAVETRRKDLKAPALDFGRKLDARAKQIETDLRDIESPIKEQLDVIDAERKRVRDEEEAAAKQALADRVAALARFDVQLPIEQIAAWSDDDFSSALAEAQEIFEAAEAKRRAAEDKATAERKAEAEKLAAERADLEKQRAEMNAEKEELAAAKRKAAQEVEDAERKVRLEEKAKERAAEAKERAEAEAKERERLKPQAQVIRELAMCLRSLDIAEVDCQARLAEIVLGAAKAIEVEADAIDGGDSDA